MMFWSKTKDVVHEFTEKRDCYVTLEDSLLGSVLDEMHAVQPDLSWSGQEDSSGKTLRQGSSICQYTDNCVRGKSWPCPSQVLYRFCCCTPSLWSYFVHESWLKASKSTFDTLFCSFTRVPSTDFFPMSDYSWFMEYHVSGFSSEYVSL